MSARRLTPEQVREARHIAELWRVTPSLGELAKRWGVSRATVIAAAERRTHREVPDG